MAGAEGRPFPRGAEVTGATRGGGAEAVEDAPPQQAVPRAARCAAREGPSETLTFLLALAKTP